MEVLCCKVIQLQIPRNKSKSARPIIKISVILVCRKGHVQIVTLLLQHGGKAVLRDVNKRGLTALGEAVVAGHTGIVDQLLQVYFPNSPPLPSLQTHPSCLYFPM